MWTLAFLFLFILQVESKSSNLCRLNPPRCDGDKVIKVDKALCVKPADPVMWTFNERSIEQTCDRVNYCDIDKLITAVDSCCGDKEYRSNNRPKLRFVYDCVQGETVTTKATTPKLPTTTLHPVVTTLSTRPTTQADRFDNFCVINICHQKPYCSAGTEIGVMKVTGSLEADQVMNSLTYYCNKRQRCTDEYEPYIDNKCRFEDSMKLHYVCMKEKVTTTVMCEYEETIYNEEGQIRSSDYPNMIPAGTRDCRIKIFVDQPSTLELFLLDLPTLELMVEDEFMDWSPPISITSRHKFMTVSNQVSLSIDFDNLPQRRIWMYYRVFPTTMDTSNTKSDLLWTTNCLGQITTPETMNVTTSNPTLSTHETSKVTMVKHSRPTNSDKGMHPMHKTEANHRAEELTTASHIVIPDGIPVDTEVVDKMAPVTLPAMPVTPENNIPSSSSNSGRDMSSFEKTPDRPIHHGNREKASLSETPTTGLYSREVVIGLIAGVVILACLVIILLTALAASMRRRRRSLADDEERDERHDSGPGGTTNENLVSFQYLKTLPVEGDSGTLSKRSQESGGDSLSGDSTSKKSLVSKPVKKKNSLAPSENGSSKTADTLSSKDDSVFHCIKNTDDYSDHHYNDRSKSVDSGLMTKNDNSFTGRGRLDADITKYTENHDGKSDDDIFRDIPHFYVNGDDYALVQKDSSRSPRNTLISDKSSIYGNSSPRPKSGSSGSVQDSDVLEWTKGFNLAV